MAGLRDALGRKQRTETHFDLVVADPTEAEHALRVAVAEVRLARLREEPEVLAEAERVEQAAREAFDACHFRLTFVNLPPHEFEELVSEHAATPEQAKDGDPWNRVKLAPELLARCTVDSDLTAEEWAAELASERWSAADALAVYRRALDANVKPRSVAVPFA